MNYMKEIIKILGVKFNEEFYLTKHSNTRFGNTRFVITPGGMFSQDENKDWCESPLLYDILLGKYEIKKIPQLILTEEEKEYLSMVIKPFKDEVYYICKNSYNRKFGWIQIGIKDDLCINLPTLKVGTMMYKGMEFDKRYSLEELGL